MCRAPALMFQCIFIAVFVLCNFFSVLSVPLTILTKKFIDLVYWFHSAANFGKMLTIFFLFLFFLELYIT